MKIIKAFVAGMITTVVIEGVLTVYVMAKKESEVTADESD